ncbi:Gim5A protein [Trypanosoma theileri]|uniref:Gim5A protein n=1 Tax=Trypanosoma theileri TaxID=67003 RepID=A0A1X0P585_9TRYP|nr:Gim5A protein [Trypanosoma theileri]ORC92092.1 Gim5A protein [Trypanosoma theileri]
MKYPLCDSSSSLICTRDRVAAVGEYSSLLAAGLAESVGLTQVQRSAKALAVLLSEYRSITRVWYWLVVVSDLSPAGLRQLMYSSPNFSVFAASISSTVAMALFLLSEEVALLSNVGVLQKSLRPYVSRLVPVFLFYYNLLKMMVSAALLCTARRISFEATDTQSVLRRRRYKEMFIRFLEALLCTLYAMLLLPTDAPRLKQAIHEGRWIDRLYVVLVSLCPQGIRVSSTTQGILGLVSTIPMFCVS